jgi:hypothetical protein
MTRNKWNYTETIFKGKTHHKDYGEKETGDKHHTEAAQPQECKFQYFTKN